MQEQHKKEKQAFLNLNPKQMSSYSTINRTSENGEV